MLLAIQQGPAPVALKDIAARAGMSPGQAHNYLTSFVRTDMLQTAGRGQYRLGPSLAALGLDALQGIDRYEVVQNEALRLREAVRLGVVISQWSDGLGPLYIWQKPGYPDRWGSFDMRSGPGKTVHTATGNVFLAWLDWHRVAPIAIEELRAEGMDANAAEQHLKSIRDRVLANGFAYQTLTELPGYAALCAPIWDADCELCFALTITGPERWVDQRLGDTQVTELIRSTSTLSRIFGAPSNYWSLAH
ncbi:MAG: helix-turn-helix domain-containing protein [Actinobacteria bacterium]|nr:helix-turn-helix domain-containing protein [Actinomycetota bacterium]